MGKLSGKQTFSFADPPFHPASNSETDHCLLFYPKLFRIAITYLKLHKNRAGTAIPPLFLQDICIFYTSSLLFYPFALPRKRAETAGQDINFPAKQFPQTIPVLSFIIFTCLYLLLLIGRIVAHQFFN